MTITNYRTSSSDVVFFKKGEHLEVKASYPEYCIFGINFDKIISYQVKKTTWKNNDPVNCKVFNAEPAIGVFITLEGEEEYILMRSMPSPCLTAVLEKIHDNNLKIEEVFDLLICDFELEFQGYFLI